MSQIAFGFLELIPNDVVSSASVTLFINFPQNFLRHMDNAFVWRRAKFLCLFNFPQRELWAASIGRKLKLKKFLILFNFWSIHPRIHQLNRKHRTNLNEIELFIQVMNFSFFMMNSNFPRLKRFIFFVLGKISFIDEFIKKHILEKHGEDCLSQLQSRHTQHIDL